MKNRGSVGGIQEYNPRTESQKKSLCLFMEQTFCDKLMAQISSHEQYNATKTLNLSDCLSLLKEKAFDVIISDGNWLKAETTDVIAEFNRLAHKTPIMLIADDLCDNSEAQYLDMGFDCVIARPLSSPLFFAKMRTLLRWRTQTTSSIYQIGSFKFKPDTKSLQQAGEENIRLTEKEAKILHFLLRHRGDVVSRARLLEYVWGYHKATRTHTVETHIYRLRKKMGISKKSKALIVTETNGYRIPSESQLA